MSEEPRLVCFVEGLDFFPFIHSCFKSYGYKPVLSTALLMFRALHG